MGNYTGHRNTPDGFRFAMIPCFACCKTRLDSQREGAVLEMNLLTLAARPSSIIGGLQYTELSFQ